MKKSFKTSGPGLVVIKLFSCSTQLSGHKCSNANNWHFNIYEQDKSLLQRFKHDFFFDFVNFDIIQGV